MNRRQILKSTIPMGVATILPNFLSAESKIESDFDLKIKRLSWAGIQIETKDKALFIDVSLMANRRPELGLATAEIKSDKPWRFAATTHLHLDHFDLEAIKMAISDDGLVICSEENASFIASKGLPVQPLKIYEPFSVGEYEANDISICAVPSEDGWGDKQVAWVISVGNKKIIHCGDTIWHGQWRKIGRMYGPFDVAFLPINGQHQPEGIAIVSDQLNTLSPIQAVEAARLLNAKLAIPIHYGRKPTATYVEIAHPEQTFMEEARKRKQPFEIVKAGEFVTWKAQ
jgi:L-ascorbate metabolism protein UlaG (beta-lactamase superfamily)